MDNQNTNGDNLNSNQPASAGGLPPVMPTLPNAPLPPLPPLSPPSTPLTPVAEPLETALPQPPVTAPQGTDHPTEPDLKPKKRFAPVILAVLALFLVVGVTGASYYISTQLTQRVAVAPNAPESKPAAGVALPCVAESDINCSNLITSGATICQSQTKNIAVYCCPEGQTIVAKTCVDRTAVGSGGVSGTPSPTQAVGSAGSTNSCPSGQLQDDDAWGWHPVRCGEGCPTGQGKPYRCNWALPSGYSCVNSGSNDYLNLCKDASGAEHWEFGACEVNSNCVACDSTKQDTAASNSIKFDRSGTVLVFTRFTEGNITLAGPSSTQVVAAKNGEAVQQTQTFSVEANVTYNLSISLTGETKNAHGWIPNKASNTCGPTKSALCGPDVDISPVKNLALANSDVTGISAGGVPANIQCWGDMDQNDLTQDYDYDDSTVIFGYVKQQTGRPDYCVSATTDKPTIVAGDRFTLSATSNTPVTKIYFQGFNLDNKDSNGIPKAICVGSEAASSNCPNGGHVLTLSDPSTTSRVNGMVRSDFATMDQIDKTTGSKIVKIQWNAYFSLGAGQPISLPQPNCVTNTTLSTSTRPDYCVSATTDKPTIVAGDRFTLSATSNTPVTKIYFQGFNLDNKDSNGIPKAICVGSEAASSNCPNGGHVLTLSDPSTTSRVNGMVRSDFATMDQIDKTTGSKIVKIQWNAYFSLGAGQPISLPQPNCVTNTTLSTTVVPPVAPACTQVQVATLKNGVWTKQTTATSITDNIKTGDTIRLYTRGNAQSARARFKVVAPNGQPAFTPEWKEGVKDATATTTNDFYTELQINTAGNYSFEAQVL